MGVIADFQIAAGGVVGIHAAGGDPLEVAMRGNWGVGLIQIGVDLRIPRE